MSPLKKLSKAPSRNISEYAGDDDEKKISQILFHKQQRARLKERNIERESLQSTSLQFVNRTIDLGSIKESGTKFVRITKYKDLPSKNKVNSAVPHIIY